MTNQNAAIRQIVVDNPDNIEARFWRREVTDTEVIWRPVPEPVRNAEELRADPECIEVAGHPVRVLDVYAHIMQRGQE